MGSMTKMSKEDTTLAVSVFLNFGAIHVNNMVNHKINDKFFFQSLKKDGFSLISNTNQNSIASSKLQNCKAMAFLCTSCLSSSPPNLLFELQFLKLL